MIELSSPSQVKNFDLKIHKGQAVVRNQRINALLGVRMKDVPPQYHDLLAKANFTGGYGNEEIVWSTDVFQDTPRRMSELNPEEKAGYKQILDEALTSYAAAIQDADKDVKDLLYSAVTYHSEDAVYCGDGRVVITEWGMTPMGQNTLMGMPYTLDIETRQKAQKDVSVPEEDSVKPEETVLEEDIPIVPREEEKTKNESNGPVIPPITPDNGNNISGGQQPPVPPRQDKKKKEDPWWKKWWLWLLLLLAILLLLGLSLFLFRACTKAPLIQPVTPPLGDDDIVLSEDSMRYVVKNRLLLLLTEQDADLDAFAADFRKKYPDADKYVLSNPNTVINRITLNLPEEERQSITETLPEEFASYGLIVIPETMYSGGSVPNDPAMKDADKRWYFDEVSAFDAWDVTQGDSEVIVAIIDDGFDLNHPELKGKVYKPYNAVTQNDKVTPSRSGHGTHVAATAIGNANNGVGTSGIAPGCKFMPIQVGDAKGLMTTSAIMDAVAYALENGADVVNMSLGMSFGPYVQFAPLYMQKNFRANMFLDEQRVWDHLFNIAKQRNVTFVLAGGNENILIGLDPMARNENTIRVSATQPDRYKASFSNYGDMSTVSAPGVEIYNAIPGNNYTFMDGTSMASPIVTGGVALLKSQDRSLNVNQIAKILRETGNPSGSDVGPIVNFARALKAEQNGGFDGECEEINRRYHELLEELEKLRREYPECIQTPDTLTLPKDFTAEDLIGRWKSTTSLYNQADEEVVIYFTFNGTPTGRLDIVEPSGATFSAPLSVSISNDIVNIDQQTEAKGPGGAAYNPYKFVIKPDRNRRAEGKGQNKVDRTNVLDFRLVRI